MDIGRQHNILIHQSKTNKFHSLP